MFMLTQDETPESTTSWLYWHLCSPTCGDQCHVPQEALTGILCSWTALSAIMHSYGLYMRASPCCEVEVVTHFIKDAPIINSVSLRMSETMLHIYVWPFGSLDACSFEITRQHLSRQTNEAAPTQMHSLRLDGAPTHDPKHAGLIDRRRVQASCGHTEKLQISADLDQICSRAPAELLPIVPKDLLPIITIIARLKT